MKKTIAIIIAGFLTLCVSAQSSDLESRIIQLTKECLPTPGTSIENVSKLWPERWYASLPKWIGKGKETNPWAIEYKRIFEKAASPTDSYTSNLLKDPNEIVKKFGSESAEFVAALIENNGLKGEALDVIYATMVGLASRGTDWQQLEQQLKQRWK